MNMYRGGTVPLKTFKVCVRKDVFYVNEVKGQSNKLTAINFLALEFWKEKNPRIKENIFKVLLDCANEYILSTARYFTKDFEICKDIVVGLQADLWRLLNWWKPTYKYWSPVSNMYNFHYIMFRQFRNFTISYLQKVSRNEANECKKTISYDSVSEYTVNEDGNSETRHFGNPFDSLSSKDLFDKFFSTIEDKNMQEAILLLYEKNGQ